MHELSRRARAGALFGVVAASGACSAGCAADGSASASLRAGAEVATEGSDDDAGDAAAPPGRGDAGASSSPAAAATGVTPLATRFLALPYLRIDAHAAAFSSADPAMKNGDYDQVLSTSGGEALIFDGVGPAVIDRWWHTGTTPSQYNLYFDGEAKPSLVLDAASFWNASVLPFVPPLSLFNAESGGGSITYFPIPFAKSLRITETGGTSGFYNIGYTRYPGAKVTSYTGVEDAEALATVLSKAGVNPIVPDLRDRTTRAAFDLEAGGSKTVFDLQGPGQITELRFLGNALAVAGNGARLQIFWDDDAAPAVDAPLGYFFATGLTTNGNTYSLAKGLALGFDGASFYSYFPMPFARRARIVLVNDVTAPVKAGSNPSDGGTPGLLESIAASVTVRAFTDDLASVGTFHATYSPPAPTVVGRDYTILDVDGSGHYVGVNLLLPATPTLLEGNDRTFVDGARTPQIAGTGTEDYFNGAWYFSPTFPSGAWGAPFTQVLSGCPTCALNGAKTMYRFLIDDAVAFTSQIHVSIQHGEDDGLKDGNQALYGSVAYYYLSRRPLSVLTDSLSPADPKAAASHAYATVGVEEVGAVTSRFWSDDPASYTYRGTTFTGKSTFTVKVAPGNQGVTLRRLLDQNLADQTATVRVDGEDAGVWRTAGGNATYRWRQDDFFIPAALTRGKSTLSVEVAVTRGEWNEFLYEVFSAIAP